MARRLILDTGVLIVAERSKRSLSSVLTAEDDVVIAAITAAELFAGVELADERFRPQRSDFVNRAIDLIPVVPYDLSIAKAHGLLLAHSHQTGRPRGAHDMIIAATAMATRRTIVTRDKAARFGELPGVDSIELD